MGEYNVFRNPGKDDNEESLHPRLVNQNTIRMNRLAYEISGMTTFSSADIKGILEAFRQRLGFHLSYGDRVELEGLGTFNISIKKATKTKATNAKAFRANTICLQKVTFRCSKELKQELRHLYVKREENHSYLKKSIPEERKQKILDYLDENDYIIAWDCCSINNCTRYIALKDLKELIREGKITRLGHKGNGMYTKVLKDI